MHEVRLAHDLQPRRSLVHQKQRLRSFGIGEHDVVAGQVAAGDEPLLAVQHPVVAVAGRGRLDAGHIGAGARLGDGPCLPRFATHDRHHPALALLRCHRRQQLAGTPVDDDEAETVRRLAGFLLDGHQVEHRQVGAADLHRHVQVAEPRRPRLRPRCIDQRRVKIAAVDDGPLQRPELFLDELCRPRLDLAGAL